MIRQRPLRTYQRKKTKQVATGQYQSTHNLTSVNASSSNRKSKLHRNKEINATIKFNPDDDSFNYDPFNTTFDRLLKNTVATNLQTGNLNNNASSDSSYDDNNQTNCYEPSVDVQRFSEYTKKQANSRKTKNNKQKVKYVKRTLLKEQNKSNSKIQVKSKLSRKVKKATNKIKNLNMSRDEELQQKDAAIISKLTSNTVSINENVLVINSDVSGSADILNRLNNTDIRCKDQEILCTSSSKKSVSRRDSTKDSQSFSNGTYMCNKDSSDNCNTSVTDIFEVHQMDFESHGATTKSTSALLVNVPVDKITKRRDSNMSCDMSLLEIMTMENRAKLSNIKPCFVNLNKITISPCKTKNNNQSMSQEVIDVTDTRTNLSSTNVQCCNLPFATGQNNIVTEISLEKYDSFIKENYGQNLIDNIKHCYVQLTPVKVESSKMSKEIISSTPFPKLVRNLRFPTSLSPINVTDLGKKSTMDDNSQTDLNNIPSAIKRLSNIQINKSDHTPMSTPIFNVCSTSKTTDSPISNKEAQIVLNYNCLPITEKGTTHHQNIKVHITSPRLLSVSEKSDRTFSLFMSSNDEIPSMYGNENKENVSYNNSVKILSATDRSSVDDLCPKKMNEILEIPHNLKRNILAIQNIVDAVSMEEQQGFTKINDELSSGHTECTASQRYLEDNKKSGGTEVHVMSTHLENPVRITKRKQYKNWGPQLTNIDESCNGSTNYYEKRRSSKTKSNNVDKLHTKKVKMLEHKSLSENGCIESDFLSATAASIQSEGILYLRPGKSWARSLSILNNIQCGSNIDELAAGKGRKWRHSVKHILDMQTQRSSGVLQSCVRSNLKVQSHVPDESTHDHLGQLSKQNALRSSNSAHFSKRISVRIVPDIKNIKASNNISLLEAYLITESEKNFKHDESYANTEINKNEDDSVIQAKDVVLQRCSQTDYLSFTECYPNEYLEHWYKIGEGVYGEVFFCDFEEQGSVIKIIPIEGNQLVNGEPQKKFSEILSEILIAKELHNLRFNERYATNGFVEVKNIKCIIGKYPEKLIELWNIYDEEKSSDNDCPSMFDECQLYIALELGHGGQDLEAFVFHSAEEAHASFIQAALALAVAEQCLEFEHRDLHWGNILLSRTDEPYAYYKLDNKNIQLPSKGIKVSIIDFTLSRISYQGCCIFNDLGLDPALFTAQGEYQFEVYRLMRDKINNIWHEFEPFTNILWLHYTLDKMITAVRYKKKTLKIHKTNISELEKLRNIILTYDSAYDFVIQCDEVKNSYMLSQHTFVPLQHTNEIVKTFNNRVCVQ